MDAEFRLLECRSRQPEEIDQSHDHHAAGDSDEDCNPRLDATGNQQHERQGEMQGDQGVGYVLPSSVQSRVIPGDLLGQIPRPNDDQLRERGIRPQHDKPQHQGPEISEPLVGQQGTQWLLRRQAYSDEDNKCPSQQDLPDDVDGRENRREPVWLQ